MHQFQPGMGYGMGYGAGSGSGSGMGPNMMRMSPADLNADGMVTASEAAEHFEARFNAFDADQDGYLMESEYLTAPCFGPCGNPQARFERRKQRMARMDADKDGKISFDEFMRAGKASYDGADEDGDGHVSVWEFRIARRNF